MITFRRIRRRDFFHFFVSILHVSEFHMFECDENSRNVACADLGKPFIFEIRNPIFWTVAQIFPQFWDVFGQNPLLHVLILAKPVFKINETLFLGLQTYHPHNVACLQNGKTFIPKTGIPHLGTTIITILICGMS